MLNNISNSCTEFSIIIQVIDIYQWNKSNSCDCLVDLFQFSDIFFSISMNESLVLMNTILRHQLSQSSRPSNLFPSTWRSSHLQEMNSALAIRPFKQSLRRFPSYVKSPSLNDDFIFFTNILPFHLKNISYNIDRDLQSEKQNNFSRHLNINHFRYYDTFKAVDDNLATCWQTHRKIRSNDFYAIDFLSIQSTVIFTVVVAHDPRLQADLDVQVSFDGLCLRAYLARNGIYKTTNPTLKEHRHAYLFDSREFNPGFRSFRYISFKGKTNRDDRFQVCEVEIDSYK